MSLLNLNSPKFSLRLSYVFFAVSVVTVLYYYRLGGSRDFGLYVNAGRAFISGENAYETQLWRSGSFGSTAIWLLSLPIPNSLEPQFFQLLSFAGFFVFANLLGIAAQKRFWIYGFILFLSPVREVLNTIQITGFVIGLLAFSLLERGSKSKLRPFLYKSLQVAALAIALDLKPHSIVFVIALLFASRIKRDLFFWAFGILIVGHTVINVINRNILEISWLRNLQSLGNASGEGGESTSIWRLVDYLSKGNLNTNLISTLVIVSILLVARIYGKRFSSTDLIVVGLIASSFMTYMHYYDLGPLSVCALVVLSKHQKSILGLACVMFMILPREIEATRNVFILILLTALIIHFLEINYSGLLSGLRSVSLAFSIFFGLHLVNYLLAFDYRLGHSLVTSQTMVLILWFLVNKLNLFQGLEFAASNRVRRGKG